MQWILLAGSASRGPTAGSSDQADILMVYAAAKGKGTAHQGSLLPRALHPGWTRGGALGAARAGQGGTEAAAQLQFSHPPSTFIIYNHSNHGELIGAACAKHQNFHGGSASGPAQPLAQGLHSGHVPCAFGLCTP